LGLGGLLGGGVLSAAPVGEVEGFRGTWRRLLVGEELQTGLTSGGGGRGGRGGGGRRGGGGGGGSCICGSADGRRRRNRGEGEVIVWWVPGWRRMAGWIRWDGWIKWAAGLS